MKTTLKLEEAGKFLLAYFITLQIGYSWWVFFAWLLAPDLSMVGYLLNTRIGAFLYNFFHHQGVAVLTGLAGWYLASPELQFAGALMFGHSAMDRMLGYGLKYSDDFKNTHLGRIGKAAAVAILLAPVLVSCSTGAGENEPEKVKAVLTEYFACFEKKDFQKMSELTTRDFVLFEDGKVFTNDSLINVINNFPKFSAKYTFDDMQVTVDVGSARMYYTNHADFVFNDTTHVSRDWLESANFRKEEGRWRIEFLHSSVRK